MKELFISKTFLLAFFVIFTIVTFFWVKTWTFFLVLIASVALIAAFGQGTNLVSDPLAIFLIGTYLLPVFLSGFIVYLQTDGNRKATAAYSSIALGILISELLILKLMHLLI